MIKINTYYANVYRSKYIENAEIIGGLMESLELANAAKINDGTFIKTVILIQIDEVSNERV